MAIWMYLLLVVYGFACLVLIAVILLQSGKGGGLSSLGAANQGLAEAFGATGAERTLTKLTTYCAVLFIVLALVISIFGPKSVNKTKNILSRGAAQSTLQQKAAGVPGAANVPGAPAGATVPSAPAPAPAAPQAPAPAAPAPAR